MRVAFGVVVRLLAASLAALLACGAVSASSGCSAIFVTPAPQHAEQLHYFDCTSGKALPVLDTVGAVLYGFDAIALGTDDRLFYGSGNDRAALAAVSGVIAAGALASAIYGYSTTSHCAKEKDALSERLYTQAPTPTGTASEARGCTTDMSCKGDRICVAGECVAPNTPLMPSSVAPISVAPAATELPSGPSAPIPTAAPSTPTPAPAPTRATPPTAPTAP